MHFGALGPLFVKDDDGLEIELGSPLQRTLLCLLLARRREVVTMDQIVEGVWPTGAPAAATTSVQTYVSNLRKALERDRAKRTSAGVILSGGGGYRLVCDEEDTDVGRFELAVVSGIQAIDAGRPDEAIDVLDRALALWRDEPYAELGELDAAVFERSRLTELFRAAQEQRTAALLFLGRDVEAVVDLEVLVREQPLRERRWEMYITALYRTGRQAEALRAYTRARETLIDQLGIEPGVELRTLEQRVIDQDPSLNASPMRSSAEKAPPNSGRSADATESPAGSDGDGRLIGRDAPMSRLRTAGTVSDGGVLRVSLVSGEAGIGKSALVETFAREIAGNGGRVWWSYCLDTAGAPALWPWMQTARALVARDATAKESLRDLLPELAGEQPRDTAPTDLAGVRFRLFEAITRNIEQAATGERLTLVLEDIHWADPATLEMLGFLVESRLRARLHIVVTRRVDETPSDALRDLLGRLARSSAVDRILLTGLRPDDIAEFSRVVGGREVSDDEAARLHAKTAGNPFFLAELARLSGEHVDGAMSGSTTGSTGSTAVIPDGVRDVVIRRLDSTDAELTSLLRVAAVAGERFHPGVVTQAAGLDASVASRLYELGERTHWLAQSQPGLRELRFTHALVRDVVLAEQTTAQRERAHWSIGMAMLDLYGDSGGTHLSEIAGHLGAGAGAGSLTAAVDMAARAAESATRRQAHDEAVTNWALAESLIEDRPTERERSMRVRLALGESLRLAGDWAAARSAFYRALADAEALGRPSSIAEAAVSFRTMWLWTWREHGVTDQRMVDALRSCLSGIGDDRRMEALVLGYLGVELFYVDREEGLRLGQMAVEIAESMDDDVLLLETLRAMHLTLKSAEHLERRIAVADRLVELATKLGNPEHEAHARVDRSFLLLQTCHPDAWREHQLARAMTEELREPMKIAHVRQHAAVWAYLRGDVAEAERLADQAHQVHGRSGFWNTKAVHEIAQVQYQNQRGTLREHLREHPAVSPDGSSPLTQPIIEIAWAYAAHLAGDDDQAMRRLTPPPQPRRGSSWLAMKYMHAVAGSAIDAPGMRELYDEMLPFAGRLAIGSEGPAVFGVMDHALGVVAARLGERDVARRWLERAVELHEQLGGGPPAHDSRRALAALGDEPSA